MPVTLQFSRLQCPLPLLLHTSSHFLTQVSKGTGGECGLRGGYVEMTNIHPGSVEEVYKVASINLCPNTVGQVGEGVCGRLGAGQGGGVQGG